MLPDMNQKEVQSLQPTKLRKYVYYPPIISCEGEYIPLNREEVKSEIDRLSTDEDRLLYGDWLSIVVAHKGASEDNDFRLLAAGVCYYNMKCTDPKTRYLSLTSIVLIYERMVWSGFDKFPDEVIKIGAAKREELMNFLQDYKEIKRPMVCCPPPDSFKLALHTIQERDKEAESYFV